MSVALEGSADHCFWRSFLASCSEQWAQFGWSCGANWWGKCWATEWDRHLKCLCSSAKATDCIKMCPWFLYSLHCSTLMWAIWYGQRKGYCSTIKLDQTGSLVWYCSMPTFRQVPVLQPCPFGGHHFLGAGQKGLQQSQVEPGQVVLIEVLL